MSTLMLNNWVCWSILLVALVCYQLLWNDILHLQTQRRVAIGYWREVSSILAAILPLLGLLGTIIGLLRSFSDLATGSAAGGALLSGGIADALVTTQMGLACAIPAWLMQGYLHHQARRFTQVL